MLPHHHFIIAAVTTILALLVFYPGTSVITIVSWIFISGLSAIFIDWDALVFTFVKSKSEKKLRVYRNPVNIFKNFKDYMNTLHETGLMTTLVKTHLVTSGILLFVVPYFLPALETPITIGVVTHLFSDIPNLNKKIG